MTALLKRQVRCGEFCQLSSVQSVIWKSPIYILPYLTYPSYLTPTSPQIMATITANVTVCNSRAGTFAVAIFHACWPRQANCPVHQFYTVASPGTSFRGPLPWMPLRRTTVFTIVRGFYSLKRFGRCFLSGFPCFKSGACFPSPTVPW